MTIRSLSTIAVFGSIASLVMLAGCTPAALPGSKVPTGPRELTIAHIDATGVLEPATAWFVEALATRSDGALTATFDFACCGGEPDAEQTLIDAVAGGDADLGWVGVRAVHDAGSQALDPFVAPLLIRGYDAQEVILESEDAANALDALGDLGVQGLGLLPGSMRYAVSTGMPLNDPAAWSGLRFYSFASAVGYDALGALGVTPLSMSFEERDAALAAGEIDALDTSIVYQAQHTDVLPYALVNVPLSSRISALVAAPDLALTDAERGWVASAVADTVARTSELGALDEEAIVSGCANGARYAAAVDDEIASFRSAFAMVDSDIASAGPNGKILDRLRTLAAASPVPTAVTCETATSNASGSDVQDALKGTFTTILWDEAAQRAHGMPEDRIEPGSPGYGSFTFTFASGLFRADLSGGERCDGTYEVTGPEVTVQLAAGPCGAGRFFTSDFAVTDESLTFTAFDSPHAPVDPILFSSEPLTRVE